MRQEFDFAGCELGSWSGDVRACRWCNTTLPSHRLTSHPSVFCTPTCTWEWKQEHVWATAKRECVRRSKSRCSKCGGKTGRPEAHHITACLGNRRPSCIHHQHNLTCLCSGCHADTHRTVREHRAA